ncbi:MAG: hypothetical protein ABI835_16355 [Chloroflexota bacterium]
MYDYDNVQMLYNDHLREARQRHAHNELVRATRNDARRDSQPGLLERVRQFTFARNPQQEMTHVRRAPAL